MSDDTPYPLEWFASQMKEKLIQNENKGGWSDCSNEDLVTELRAELAELWRACNSNYGGKTQLLSIIEEAADVANYAMMIADNANNVMNPQVTTDTARSKPQMIRDQLEKCSGSLDLSKRFIDSFTRLDETFPYIQGLVKTAEANRQAIYDLRMAVSLLTDYREDEEVGKS